MTIRVTGSTDSGYLYEFDMPPRNWKLPVGFGIKMSSYPGYDCEVVDNQKEDARPWTGEGLPPVGTVCEFRVETDDWRQCEIIAHKDGLAVCWIHCNKIFATNGSAVRPIRTPEQIAAEERETEISEMLKISRETSLNTQDICEGLYSAGYRKRMNR